MKQQYQVIRFNRSTRELITLINSIISDYASQGFRLSVRQLYYQLVTKNVIENTEKSYKRVASIINDGRLAGEIDWDAIEDRNRDIETRSRWDSGSSILNAVASQFHMDMWENQESRIFVIVEKAALAGVLDRVCRQYDVPLLAARGYPSVSIMREMALQHIWPAVRDEQHVTILHLGDHDPSGIDMTRDLNERLNLFMPVNRGTTLKRIALTMDQVEEQQPPPNPAKTTDTRFAAYRDQYGDESWELDALNPNYITGLVEGEVKKLIDEDLWVEKKEKIYEVKEALKDVANDFNVKGL